MSEGGWQGAWLRNNGTERGSVWGGIGAESWKSNWAWFRGGPGPSLEWSWAGPGASLEGGWGPRAVVFL